MTDVTYIDSSGVVCQVDPERVSFFRHTEIWQQIHGKAHPLDPDPTPEGQEHTYGPDMAEVGDGSLIAEGGCNVD